MTAPKSPEGAFEHLRAIVYKEGDLYIAQCLERDIAAQAPDIQAVLERLDLTIEAECALSKERCGGPFDGIAPAPVYFHDLWNRRSHTLQKVAVPVDRFFDVEVALADAA